MTPPELWRDLQNRLGPSGEALVRGRRVKLLSRVFARVALGVCLVLVAYDAITLATDPRFAGSAGFDFAIYRDAAIRWIQGAFFYYPAQLAGPYELNTAVMYPPITLLLFVPFALLPALLWWILPLSAVAWRCLALRPSQWGWVGIAACLAWPLSLELVLTGNPVIWTAAFLALSTRWPWVSTLVLLKPSLGPFALAGVRTRGWWIALGSGAVISLLFLPMWFDWLRVLQNARGPFSGPLYSIHDVPLMLIPALAWATRRRGLQTPGRHRLRGQVGAEGHGSTRSTGRD